MTHRPDWDSYFIKMCESVALRSPDKKRKVGCVIVDDNKRVVATGFNGTPPGFDDSSIDWWNKAQKEKVVIHAEANAIIHADGPRLAGGSLYCTYSPCEECAKLIAGTGLRRVVFYEVSDSSALELLKLFGVEVEKMSENFNPKQ